ncbi:MAG: DNA polymerase III subunit gamma/tau [Oscillospiraceae bacterium]|nr:DNA polymerase III subunit gamma/tau [Oscillospiraceae bacterium]
MYQVLYRKWRSQTFSEVVGQPHVTDTLKQALASGRLSHAYLFTGPRGTGKTSCARLLAKAVNCLHPHGGEPCNACEMCKGIDMGTVMDVIEIDAASNNGVDNIRDLREETNFTPSQGNYRVYIIDEVHMLSAGAFNALLKTLEEPPSYVMFILATTEVHKLPATVLSRCQRFDFHRITAEDIAARLQFVAAEESIELDQSGAVLLARVADGAMRDALSLLDRCRVEGQTITAETVSRCIGIADRSYLFALLDAISAKNIAEILELLHALYQDAIDMERLCEELLGHVRNLLVINAVQNPQDLILSTTEDQARFREQAKRFATPQLLRLMRSLEDAGVLLRRSTDRRMEMEIALIGLCSDTPAENKAPAASASVSPNVTALETRVASLESVVRVLRGQTSTNAQSAQVNTQNMSAPPQAEDTSAPPSTGQDRAFLEWGQVLDVLKTRNAPLAGVLAGSSAIVRGEFLLIKTNNAGFGSFIKNAAQSASLKDAIAAITGKKPRLGILRPDENTPVDPLAQLTERAEQLGILAAPSENQDE